MVTLKSGPQKAAHLPALIETSTGSTGVSFRRSLPKER
jgi:hypothetical protein